MKAIDDLKSQLKARADVNGDGKVTLADVNFALDHANTTGHVMFWIGVTVGAVLVTAVGYIKALVF